MGIFSANKNELKVRPEVRSNPEAYECLRVWMQQGAPMVHIEKIREIDDPRAWGSVLADVAAFASHKYDNDKDGEALAAIQEMFNSLVGEWVKQRRENSTQ